MAKAVSAHNTGYEDKLFMRKERRVTTGEYNGPVWVKIEFKLENCGQLNLLA